MSLDGTKVAYVSTASNYKANIWVLDLNTGTALNLTNKDTQVYLKAICVPLGLQMESGLRSARIAIRNGVVMAMVMDGSTLKSFPFTLSVQTELTFAKSRQTLHTVWAIRSGIYIDGKRVIYYEMTTEHTWGAHRPESLQSVSSQLLFVSFETSTDIIEHTSGTGFKTFPQWLLDGMIAYLLKNTASEGLGYVTGNIT